MTDGICRNPSCANAQSKALIERYPGAGEYCPECGEELEALRGSSALVVPSAPFGGLSALEALERFDAEEPPSSLPESRPRRRARRPPVASALIGIAAAASILVLHPSAIGRPVNSDAVRVCGSSMTEHFARETIQAYARKSGLPPSRFFLAQSGPCDVRFSVSDGKSAGDVVGGDGIVVIVNPANTIARLDQVTLRRIFRGEITDWSQAGGTPGPIVAIAPEEGSDEAALPVKAFLQGAGFGVSVLRPPNSAEVTRAVVRANGRGAIGLVAFSEAIPAKVITIGNDVPPSPLSIAERRYPLSLGITVAADPAARPPASALAEYARSEEAQGLVSRSGLVPKKGI